MKELRTELDRRRAMERVLTASIREKDGLLAQRRISLHEVAHYVKNSIATAIAMLRLQIARCSKAKVSEALEDVVGRLEHLARIHEILYRQDSNDVQRVDMAAYLSELCRNFAHLQGRQYHRIGGVGSDADDIALHVDRAINMALIAGETISNALKHAFPEPRRGAVRVGLHHVKDNLVLSVEDNGIRLPAERRPWECA